MEKDAWYTVMDMIDVICQSLEFNDENSQDEIAEFRDWSVAHTDFEPDDEEQAARVTKLVIAEAAKRFC